jgi:cyclopropane-fatty-acyl-phospholipid synthase
MTIGTSLAEHGLVPDVFARRAIRGILRDALRTRRDEAAEGVQQRFVESLPHGPVAVATDSANAQHYELPAAFFAWVLGPHRKYSCCLYPTGKETLPEAEEAMLRLTSERAQLADGQDVLELGCGWGSLSLWMASQYPNSRITAMSNSHSQRAYIEAEAQQRGLTNLTVITSDINDFDAPSRYDRVVSVEMFEHVLNHTVLFARISRWLKPRGRLFVHIFCHRNLCYPYVTEGRGNWMARHFFTGGMMPAYDLLPGLDTPLALEERWAVNGLHYLRTCNHWLENLDASRAEVAPLLRATYGKDAPVWFQRWRMFFLACAELFGYAGGEEWFVGHYRFAHREQTD